MFPFYDCVPMAVVGPTSSGKTYWTYQLLKCKDKMFTLPPQKVLYCYTIWQKLYDDIEGLGFVTFHEGLPTEAELRDFADGNFNLLVLDDLLEQVSHSALCRRIFTIFAHHLRLGTIFLTQSMYADGTRTISLQIGYFIFMKNLRDLRQSITIGSQLYVGQSQYFFKSLKDAVLTRNWGYLVAECTPRTTHPYVLRTKVFPGEVTEAYVIDDEAETLAGFL